jgi:hypothetical protein
MGLIAALMLGLMVYIVFRRSKRRQLHERQQVIQRLIFDSSIHRRVADKYPHLTSTQVQQVLDGLKDYFHLSLQAKGVLSMPSQAVDEAWHAFILSTKAYASFCQRAFGRFLHHHPAETMTAPTQATQGIRRVWTLACQRERINAASPERLPRLFALDRELNIPHGFYYSLNCMAAVAAAYCASHIGSGCGGSSGCSNGESSSSDSGDSSSGCGGGCGGGGD